jgi:ribosomal protein L34E
VRRADRAPARLRSVAQATPPTAGRDAPGAAPLIGLAEASAVSCETPANPPKRQSQGPNRKCPLHWLSAILRTIACNAIALAVPPERARVGRSRGMLATTRKAELPACAAANRPIQGSRKQRPARLLNTPREARDSGGKSSPAARMGDLISSASSATLLELGGRYRGNNQAGTAAGHGASMRYRQRASVSTMSIAWIAELAPFEHEPSKSPGQAETCCDATYGQERSHNQGGPLHRRRNGQS